VDLLHPLEAEIPALERSGAEVLGDDVGVADELEQELLAALRAQVERDALLVAGLDGPPERAAFVAGLAPLADRVGAGRVLDLDDLRAQVAEQAAGEWSGEQRAELDQPHAGERPDSSRFLDRGRRFQRLLRHGSTAGSEPAFATSRSRASNTCSRIRC